MRRVKHFVAIALLIVAAACAKYEIPVTECPEGTSGVSFQSDIQPIFNSKCIACHSGGQSPNLSAGWSYDELVSGGYVSEPDFACESRLYQVFSGSHSGRVSEDERMMILGWIQDGAEDN